MINKHSQAATQRHIYRPLLSLSGIFAALLLGACAGTASEGSQQASSDQECTYVRVTGSNMPVKQCRTSAERAAIAARNEAEAQQELEDRQLLEDLDAIGSSVR